jgi:hypothetical protein
MLTAASPTISENSDGKARSDVLGNLLLASFSVGYDPEKTGLNSLKNLILE